MSHTPGPWRIGYKDGSGADRGDWGPFTIQTTKDEMIVDAAEGETADMWSYAYGVLDYDDARLIATAPELKTELKKLVAYMEEYQKITGSTLYDLTSAKNILNRASDDT